MTLWPVSPPRLELNLTARTISMVPLRRDWWPGWGGRRLRRSCSWPLPKGLVRLSASERNVSDVPALVHEIRSFLDRLGGRTARSRCIPVSLTLPDLCARMALFDFDTLPRKRDECETLLRWRLQQEFTLPPAGLRLGYRLCRATPPRVLVVAVRDEIAAQYEQACEEAGCVPVSIDLSSLRLFDLCRPAMLATAASSDKGARVDDLFFAHLTQDCFVFIALNRGLPAFLRLKPCRPVQTNVADELLATLQFYTDRYLFSPPSPADPPRPLFLIGSRDTPDGAPTTSDPVCLDPRFMESLRLTVIPVSRDSRQVAPHGSMLTFPLPCLPTRNDPPPLPHLHIALTARGFEFIHAGQWAMVLLLLGSLGTAGWLWWERQILLEEAAYYELATRRDQEANRQFLDKAARAGLDLSDERMREIQREVTFANQFLERRAFSWTRLLNDLEEAVPPNVSISSVGLNVKDSTIMLNGTALTLADLTALVNRLEGHRSFLNVILSRHTFRESGIAGETNVTGAVSGKAELRIVEFAMTVMYRPSS